METGKVLRFDSLKGYGFIEPDNAGDDVFLHVNDLLVDKRLIRSGIRVTFVSEMGARGIKASKVGLLNPPPSGDTEPVTVRPVRPPSAVDVGDEPMCDVLSPDEFLREVTELLLRADPTLQAAQVVVLRERLVRWATSFGWVEPRPDQS